MMEKPTEQKPALTFATAKGFCERHGEFTTEVMVMDGVAKEPICMECSTDALVERSKAESKRLDDERRERYDRIRIDNIGLPLRMRYKRWADYKPANAKAKKYLATCMAFADNWTEKYESGSSLIMTGGTGCGKTHLASVLCKQVAIQHTITPKYATVSGMLRYIRASYNKNCEYTETDAFGRFAYAPLLVIDEVGVKLSSDYEKSILFEIIDERYQGELPTVLISNLSIDEINEYIDERMVDRLSENGQLMVFDWDSHRGVSACR